MKVRDRLSLQFTLMFAILLLIVLAGIYLLENNNREISFYQKLEGRALVAGELYLAQDNMSIQSFKEVLKEYPQTLPGEHIRIYNDRYQPVFIKEDTLHWPTSLIQKVTQKKKVFFSRGKEQVVGIYYVDNSGDFVIIASATDEGGRENLGKLAWIMFFSYLCSLFITFFLGRIFARIALRPITNTIDNVKIIRATSLNKRLPVSKLSDDEINQLSVTINTLLEHLEQSFNDQQAFITNASHELRTPLTSILGNAEISLKSERSPEEYKNTLLGIIKDTVRLNDILNSLFELAQVTINSPLEKIRLDELLWSVVDEVKEKYNKGGVITLDYNLPDDEKKITIQGNPSLLFIALGNILKNAVKFSGGKEVNCKMQCNANEVVISIIDSGIGINPGEFGKIFQPFYRSENARPFEGSGIGLPLAQKIIRLHNGRTEVLSEQNKGTEFKIILPV